MTGTATPRVFTIPPGAPFLDTLSEALLRGDLVPGFVPAREPLDLAAATILVPTRRAARALAATIAHHAAAPAVLLPRILPLGGLEAIETDLAFDDTALNDPFADDLPAAIAPIPRRMILTRLILQWAQAVRRAIVAVEPGGTRRLHPDEELLVAASPADAWTLAGGLADLSDALIAEGIEAARLAPLGTEAHDHYWRITLNFLAIVLDHWPRILAARGEVDAVRRQMALVEAEIARLGRGGAAGPLVVAGSTGTNPATARLIGAIARLPRGAVVLPGLDQDLDETGWAAIAGLDGEAATHPQAALRRLIGAIGIDRHAVRPLGRVAPALTGRCRFVGEALRPAETTDHWRTFTARDRDPAADLAGLALIEAADEREEALAIAVALREALEGPGTALLVTPDRTLGRRVREELGRWSIDIDDSAGEPLGQTPAGAFARLVLDGAVQDLAPIEVLALLAHPLARFGRTRAAVAALARTLEIAILRGVLPRRALHDPQGLIDKARRRQREARVPDPLKRLTGADFDDLAAFTGAVVETLRPLAALRPGTPLPDWLAAHVQVIERATETPDGDTSLSGIDGHALLALFDALAEAPEPAITLDAAGYAALFDRLAAGTPVRGPNRSHPRLKILGLLEARLMSADLVVLGGLDEGVWPPAASTDAFLNRPMRAELGLPAPERRIGQTAHDLAMLLGAPRVIMTRARKRGGAPTVPSRFLLRMAALAGPHWSAAEARGAVYRRWAGALDRPERTAPIARPAPKPPVALRPRALSVTRIETLRRDPYAIYAESILRLVPSQPIGAPMGPAEVGTAFHDVMARFSGAYPAGPLPGDAADLLRRLTHDAFGEVSEDPALRAFLWPRIAAWAEAFLAWERGRRVPTPPLIEQRGRLILPLLDGSEFTLSGVADRIESDGAGGVRIVDYKTGKAPSLKEVRTGFAPQLTLEAAMVERGAFDGLGERATALGALYVKFEAQGPVRQTDLVWTDAAFDDIVAEHFKGLITLLNQFRDPNTGYLARPYPQFVARFGAYDHLARVKEWANAGSAEDEA